MNTIDVLQDLVIEGWKFWSEENRLCYRAPKEKSSSKVLTQLKQRKVEIIQLLKYHPEIFNIYPLSHSQKALWFLWQLEPLSPAYNQIFSGRIFDDVNVPSLLSAFEKLIERHPCLRSTSPKIGEEPIQQVHHTQAVDFQQIDASDWSEAKLYSSVKRESQQSFDLEHESVLRVRLFSCSAQEHILLITIHHIATDGWSLGIILSELTQLYQAHQDDVAASLPPLNYSYFDYVHSHKTMLESSRGEGLWYYWKDKLKGKLPELDLPTDKPRPPIQTYNGASHKFQLSDQLVRQIKQLAQSTDTTLYMLLLATFEVLLYRYTGQEDILVGSPIAGRLQPQFKEVVGYFVNLVVMRGDLSNNPSFKEFLTQIRQTVLEAFTHQEYPFALLVEKLRPHRDPSRSPIFQAFFALQQLHSSREMQKFFVHDTNKEFIREGLDLRPFDIPQQEGQFDLTLEMIESSESIFGSFKYNTDLFEESTIERMAVHFQNLLSAIVEDPQKAVGNLPLLSAEERQQLLVKWNDTKCEYPHDKCIHQLFEQQVDSTPDAVAVEFENQQLSYLQLNQRANSLAHYLKSLGVEPEVLVGICVERSIDMVVGLLGILKAGGAYVPIDPHYPEERLSYMLADSGVVVLLTQSSLLASLPSSTARVVCLDTDWQLMEQHPQENLDVGVRPDNLAYVIYTSGSTGQPKGVQICHQSVVNLLNSMQYSPGLTSKDTIYSVTTISFDIAALEIYLPLTIGAKVSVASRQSASNADWLLSQLSSSKATVMQATPATWQMLLASGWSSHYPLKVLCGGEALPTKLAREILETGSELWNLYGPTETTIWSASRQIVASETLARANYSPSSIGRPIANTQAYILDPHLQPVPIGIPGELYIGGDGLARGYLNRPDLTAEKFIANPFGEGRLYKTGDLARYLLDGNIEYLGRIDHQVKLRGFRIELGEIESILNHHEQVQQCAVILREDTPGNKCLVAYLVGEDTLEVNTLREFLKQQLPGFMMPSAFIQLDTFPLTPNGKIDRKAFPAPAPELTRTGKFFAPQTQQQRLIAGLFAQVLSLPVESIGLQDNFFELGGHSLLATQLMCILQESFNINIPLRALFEYPSVEALANSVENYLESNNYQSKTKCLKAEAVLDENIQPSTALKQKTTFPKQILLTGATGFLGSYLLYELLNTTDATIYCLVRADDFDAGYLRLKNKLQTYGLWRDSFTHRMIPVIGDLAQYRFSLSAKEYENLCHKIDIIYHNGARVNHTLSYNDLKPENVLGTQEILRLASSAKLKPLHYVSTISIFVSSKNNKPIFESEPLHSPDLLQRGYAQSKWVAEQLVWQASRRGLPVSIYRPSRIVGHSQTGISNSEDILCLFLKACNRLKSYPVLTGMQDNLVPVDYVSQAIVYLSKQTFCDKKAFQAFHLTNPCNTYMNEICKWVTSLGYEWEEIDYKDWYLRVVNDSDNPFFPLLSILPQFLPEESNIHNWDCTNVINCLSGSSIQLPSVDIDLFETYLKFLSF
ncbi:MAG: amino acid adenylation domain-containing protein [Leptolyngbya sp. LCM1.Bin17]|nr:MAG: amino acid adenylation domain-containing protein [Leptolyngbya sp. LCM1.Bin17]